MSTADDRLERYLLEHDVRATTIEYYRRVWRVFHDWLKEQPDKPAFNPVTVSCFLRYKQESGCSSYYRRSLRSGLVAILRHHEHEGRVRPVRLTPLPNLVWTTSEVIRLVGAARQYPFPRDPNYWPSLIPGAYYSGFGQVDLETIARVDVAHDGTIVLNRSRTGKREVGWIPLEVIACRPHTGPLWRRPFSLEMFRRHFARIVNAAGLTGTFKRLRKSSGTAVEEQHPGKGHLHLGNTRPVFERFYLSANHVPKPLIPPSLGETG